MLKKIFVVIFAAALSCLLALMVWLYIEKQKAIAEAVQVKGARNQLQYKVTTLEKEAKMLQAKMGDLESQLKKKAEDVVNSTLIGTTFTTGISEVNIPNNNLQQISINEKRLYVFMKWRLSKEDHYYKVKIFDGSEKLVSEVEYKVRPEQPIWNTWIWYSISKYVDTPGQWKVEVYLDGRKAGEKYLTVLSESEPNEVPEVVPSEKRG